MYEYTVVTSHGDVHLKTELHHTSFASVEDFLRHHHETVAFALNAAKAGFAVIGLFLQHGRKGPRLR